MKVLVALSALAVLFFIGAGLAALWLYCMEQAVEYGPELAGQIAARVHRAYLGAQP